MDFSTIIEGSVKFRDGKKWKSRWCVMRKLSPVADCLHLQLYRDSRDRYKQGLTKASLSLQHFLGLETGFTLDKESNTVAIVCQDLIVVLAFDTRERLIQWQVKIYTHLGEDEQYLIQISSSPPKAKLSAGPAKLHIQEHRFCLTIGVPPKLVGSWEIKHLRRFGVVDGKFCFEGGSLCGRGEGLYVFLTDQAEEITHHVQLAAEGKLLKTCKRPSLSNPTAGQCQSPRRSLTLKNATHRITSQMINDDNETDMLRNGSSITDDHDVRRWPSVETQADLYGHADTSSLTDFAIDSQNAKVCNWGLENQLMGRCVSCVGKLGLISRCSTAANTPGSINFNPWSNHDSKLCLDGGTREEDLLDELNCSCGVSCGAPSVSHKSKYSDRSSSGGRTDYSEEHSCCSHSSTENISKKPSSVLAPSSPPPKNFSSSSDIAFSNGAPPSRPPKPQKYRTLSSEKKVTNAPMPLPNENADEADVKSRTTCIRRNYDSPSSVENEVAPADLLLYKKNMCSDASQFYDTPRNMKKVVNESFANYDVPPPAIHHVYDDCLCVAKARLSLRPDDRNCSEDCFCGKIARYPPVWFQLPLHHFQCKNHWPNVERMTEKMAPTDAKDGPVYAQVDLSKKLKNRLICTKESEAALGNRQPRNSENCVNDSAGRCYTNLRFGHNINKNGGGVGVDESAANYDRLANLNYMNLEFTNSLRYYENVRELMKNRDSSRIDSLNIDLPANSSLSGVGGGGGGRCRENQCCKCAPKSDAASNGTSLEMQFENYVPMSPLKTATKRLAIRNGGGGTCGRNIAVETLSLDRRASKTTPTPTTAAAAATTTTMMMTMMMMITTTTASSTTYAAATTTAATMASGTASTSTRASSAATACNVSSPSTPNATSVLRHGCESDATLDARKRSNSIECGTQLARCEPQPPKGSLGDSDSGLESDKLSQENDDTVENLKRRKGTQLLGLRRFASNGYKATNANANRDSSSSNDSGFSAASLKYACNEFSDFEMPLTTATSSAKRHHSFNQRCRKNDCTLPRRSKSSDPLRDLTFHFHKDVGSSAKSSSAEAELPLCLNKRDRCKDCPSPADTTASAPYVDCRSTSSGTSDMSDYIETLSLSSHSSADVHSSEAVKLHQSAVTTLKPRSGVEYQKIDRSSLLASQSKF